MQKKKTKRQILPELLAPAGSLETFHAGFEAGADAFYMGLGDFNARRRAKNFTEKDFISAAGFAHLHGRKVYVTLNTLVFDDEFPVLLDALTLLEEYRADGVIVQDIGVFALVRDHFPSLPIHASTQMFCHNSMGAAFLKEQGAERIILARELFLSEIGAVMNKVPMDYEVFIHGAMCFSFSGCCLYSSYLFGDSGNRGRCRQPCRLPDEGSRPPLFPFSMKDLSAGEYLRPLVNLGVRALKIEGRLKNARYVYDTVSHYRRELDRIADGTAGTETVDDTGMRQAGPGYFPGADYGRMVQTASPGTVGEAIGEVLEASRAGLVIRAHAPLRKGMKLRVTDARGRKVHEGTLLDFIKTGRGQYLWRTVPERTPKGKLMLFLTGTSGGFTVRREIAAAASRVKHVPAALDLHIRPGRIEAAGTVPSMGSFAGKYEVPAEDARSFPLPGETVRELFSQSDKTPFEPVTVNIHIDGNPFIPLSTLKKVRREFYLDLYRWYTSRREEQIASRKNTVLNRIRETRTEGHEERGILFGAPPPGETCARCLKVIEYDRIGPEEMPAPESVIRLPLFVSEDRLPALLHEVRAMTEKGYTRWMIPSHGWTGFFREFIGFTLFAGPLLYCVNTFAWVELKRLGITGCIVSPDITAAGVRHLPGGLKPEGLPRELMATRLRLPRERYRCAGVNLRVLHYKEYDCVIGDYP